MLNQTQYVPASKLGRHLLTFCLAGALAACGGGSSSPAGGGPGGGSGGGGGGGGGGGPAAPSLQSISLTPGSVTLATGAQQLFTVTGAYSDGTSAAVEAGVAWSSSNPSVASMGGPGLVMATRDSTSAGATTIIASVGALTASATVTVEAATLQSVSVEPASASISVPVLQSFSAIGHYSDGTTAPLVGVTWTCSDPTIATVDGAGFAQGVKAGGPVTITATGPGGLSATASLTIAPPVLQGITLWPRSDSVPQGFDRQFVVTGQYSDGSSAPLTADVTYSSSNTARATIDANGLAHGVAAGAAATITATHGAFTSSSELIVLTPEIVNDVPAGVVRADGAVGPSGDAHYRFQGLDPATDYLVQISSSSPVDPTNVQVEVDADFAGTALICSSWASGPACRAGKPSATGDILVTAIAPEGTPFRVDVWPLPVLALGATIPGTVMTEEYYKVEGLAPLAAFTGTLDLGSTKIGDPEAAADLFAYDGPHGPMGAAQLASTVLQAAPVKGAAGVVPLAGGPIYVTVEGWLISSPPYDGRRLTSDGASYKVGVTTP